MSNIIKVIDLELDIDKPFPVLARALWQGLDVGKDFTNWMKDQIERSYFNEGIHYQVFAEKGENPQGGRARTEYYLTTNTAKHIALMSNTGKGRQYRQALINLESQHFGIYEAPSDTLPEERAQKLLGVMLNVCSMLSVPTHLAQIESCKYTRVRTGVDFLPLLKLAPTQDNILPEHIMLEPTECAKHFGFKSATAFNRRLKFLNLQQKTSEGWEPVGESSAHVLKHAWAKKDKSGYNLKWNVSFLEKIFSEKEGS